MHRIASVAVIAVTAYFLIATSKAPCTSTPSSVTVVSRGTCGPDTTVVVAIDNGCGVTVDVPDAGLPTRGNATSSSTPLLSNSIYLQTGTGGNPRLCLLDPNDAGNGWDLSCTVNDQSADAGFTACEGTLSP